MKETAKLINLTILSLTLIYLLQAMFYGKKLTIGLLTAFALVIIYRFLKPYVK